MAGKNMLLLSRHIRSTTVRTAVTHMQKQQQELVLCGICCALFANFCMGNIYHLFSLCCFFWSIRTTVCLIIYSTHDWHVALVCCRPFLSRLSLWSMRQHDRTCGLIERAVRRFFTSLKVSFIFMWISFAFVTQHTNKTKQNSSAIRRSKRQSKTILTYIPQQR